MAGLCPTWGDVLHVHHAANLRKAPMALVASQLKAHFVGADDRTAQQVRHKCNAVTNNGKNGFAKSLKAKKHCKLAGDPCICAAPGWGSGGEAKAAAEAMMLCTAGSAGGNEPAAQGMAGAVLLMWSRTAHLRCCHEVQEAAHT